MNTIEQLKDEITILTDEIANLRSKNKKIDKRNEKLETDYEQLEIDNRKIQLKIDSISDDEKKKLKNLVNKNKAEIDKNKAEIDKNKAEIDKYKAEIDKYKAEIDKYKAEIEKIQSKLDKTEIISQKRITGTLSDLAISEHFSSIKICENDTKKSALQSSGYQPSFKSSLSSRSASKKINSSIDSSQSAISSIRSNESIKIANDFSKLNAYSKLTICMAYEITPLYYGDKINWIDLPKDKMPNYHYTKFDWPSSSVGTYDKNNKVSIKHKVNECDDTKAASDHLFKEINLFLDKYNGSSLESMFVKIIVVNNSKNYNLDLSGFDSRGRTDLIVSTIFSDCELLMNYCNIQLKAVVKYKHEDGDEIFKSSKAEHKKLTGQSIAELLGSTRFSSFPVMQFTTDLDQNFHIMILSNNNNQTRLHHYDLNGTDAIATIAMWLYYFCPHLQDGVPSAPITKDLNQLQNIESAHQQIKKKMITFDSQKLKLNSVAEENHQDNVFPISTQISSEIEDNNLKCLKWVNSLTFKQ